MALVNIRDVEVKFPFPPYQCQIAYMDKVIEAIEMKFDTALESPTGTGKTLSLLCATLAWLQKQKMNIQLSFADAAKHSSGSAPPLSSFLPRIYYCSRTHSQLSQVVRELNRTTYKDIRTTVVGSRDQLCIHEKVSKVQDTRVKTSMCNAMVSKRSCHYFNNWDKTSIDQLNSLFMESGNIPDIEDMVVIGQKHRICPFFRCRQMQETAELVLLPYNYIIDPVLRKIHRVDLNGSIVIFDEAHNMENICEDVMSVEISSVNIALAIGEVKDAIECMQNDIEETRSELDNIAPEFGTEKSERAKGPAFELGDAAVLLSLLFELETKVEEILNDKSGRAMQDFPGKVYPGDRLLQTFEAAGFSFDKADAICKLLSNITDYVEQKNESTERGKNLALMKDFISVVYTSLSKEAATAIAQSETGATASNASKVSIDPKRIGKHFKLYVVHDDGSDEKPESVSFRFLFEFFSFLSNFFNSSMLQTTLKFWCFSSSIAMRALKVNGVRTVIVTSGTLSPLSTFTRNIGLNFGSTLENEHAAKGNQVIAGLIKSSPMKNYALNGSYAKRHVSLNRCAELMEYAVGIAECILSLASSVPQGMLVFFSSYNLMYSLISKFKQYNYTPAKSYWDCIAEHKAIVIEPKQKTLLNKVRSEFTQGVRSGRGAIFFAVCRGKVSEGIDFSDADSRAVCVVGIPYPPLMDVRVCLKRLHINETAAEDKTTQSSDDWYVSEGYRAVNQALGRVIRHKDDFGVVALLDERYAAVKSEFFPSWIRSSLKVFDSGTEFIEETRKFFKDKNLEVKVGLQLARIFSTFICSKIKNKIYSSRNLPYLLLLLYESITRVLGYVAPCDLYVPNNDMITKTSECKRSSSLLSLCEEEEVNKAKSKYVPTIDTSIVSEPSTSSQTSFPIIRKKLKMTVGSSYLSFYSTTFAVLWSNGLWYTRSEEKEVSLLNCIQKRIAF
ncbi:unnamed protein product [Nippostrongylus brasiliensis]|uniref:DNA helicase n=1 Tax=Nippostrongylus brasiliensis TaxID=27835 RepID=A0A158QYJ7_NIPBR|nr:unnamed protein product [Nippostrongylus brasiliensis]